MTTRQGSRARSGGACRVAHSPGPSSPSETPAPSRLKRCRPTATGCSENGPIRAPSAGSLKLVSCSGLASVTEGQAAGRAGAVAGSSAIPRAPIRVASATPRKARRRFADLPQRVAERAAFGGGAQVDVGGERGGDAAAPLLHADVGAGNVAGVAVRPRQFHHRVLDPGGGGVVAQRRPPVVELGQVGRDRDQGDDEDADHRAGRQREALQSVGGDQQDQDRPHHQVAGGVRRPGAEGDRHPVGDDGRRRQPERRRHPARDAPDAQGEPEHRGAGEDRGPGG